METYYCGFEKKLDGASGEPVLVAHKPNGKAFAVGSGATLDDARKRLKALVGESMATLAEHADDPMGLLTFGIPGEDAISFDLRDLFPIMLRFKRCSLGFTQVEVAERMGISQPAYAKYERYDANPTMETLSQLERALGVPVMIPHRQVA